MLGLIVVNALGPLRTLIKNDIEPDLARLYEKKFATIAPLLKPGEQVGYIADNEIHPVTANGATDPSAIDLQSMRRFFICQFTLAPTILIHSSGPAKVVGNFSTTQSAKTEAEAQSLEVLQEGSNGAVLCEHKEKK